MVSLNLWERLNSKERLCNLAPASALPARRVVRCAALKSEAPQFPVYLKAAGDLATGWGYAVRYVSNKEEMQPALDHFEKVGVDRVLVEEAVDVTVCWCANLGVVDGAVTFLGAAEQTFSAPAQQSGSVIDPEAEFPAEGIALAMDVAKAAAREGFRGICGLDIGLARDGRMIVFDPNFRVNASTVQVLMHPAAVARSGLDISASFAGQTTRPMAEAIAQVKGPVSDGWFVPTRLLDQAYLSAVAGKSLCTGFVMGRTRAETEARSAQLARLLA